MRIQWWWALVAVTTIAAFIVLSELMTSPPTIHRLTLANETPYDFDINATDKTRDGWTGIGIANAHSTKEFNDVIDQGHTWIFHFAAQGQDGGEVQISRGELARNDWHIDIPAIVAQRIRATGASPSPPKPTNR
jgi:hypothetical protein